MLLRGMFVLLEGIDLLIFCPVTVSLALRNDWTPKGLDSRSESSIVSTTRPGRISKSR